ncbi:DinB family protein [Bacillus sp. RG28]|uniref:DinB family protein n=1 Tax=Gottfriedia endophytica TaxID=2820819 RepID=A0A940NM33_9BACI|nr:DinB family protein [Gottfriedia endophytica]MBP0724679.1 DinB family protein [Gottfriedia endophytica]
MVYVEEVLNQLNVAVESVKVLLNYLNEENLNLRPIEGKRSIGELAQHQCECIGADLKIIEGSTQYEMEQYYNSIRCYTIRDLQELLTNNIHTLHQQYLNYTESELFEIKTSYWGASYSRFEWLVQIVAHFYHHRAQLHLLITQYINEITIPLFE